LLKDIHLNHLYLEKTLVTLKHKVQLLNIHIAAVHKGRLHRGGLVKCGHRVKDLADVRKLVFFIILACLAHFIGDT